MPIRNLDAISSPKSIAVIGASDTPGKVGFTVLSNLAIGGFEGKLYPVNPLRESVQGKKCFAGLKDLPATVDLAVICTPAPSVPGLVEECGRHGVRAIIVLTAGFREMGSQGRALEEQIGAVQKSFRGMRIVGPNCLGVISPWSRMNASFSTGMPKPGSVAFLSQSGALCTAVLDWAISQGIGFSHFISLGNQLDVGFADLLDFLADDPRTTSALLYVESISQARYFMSAARAFARRKPLIAYKAGRFAASAQAAASHTGAMAGVDAVYQAAFDRAGIVRVFDMESLFECAELLTLHPHRVGPRLAIVTNAGGPGVMATDALLSHRGQLAELSDESLRWLDQFLPPSWSHGNPVDVLGDADEHRMAQAVEIVVRDPNVDSILAILTPQAMTAPSATATMLGKIAIPRGKTIMASWMGGDQMFEARRILQQAKIPHFETPEKGIRGLIRLLDYARSQEALTETPQVMEIELPGEAVERRRLLQGLQLPVDRKLLDECDSKKLLRTYGIPTTDIRLASTVEQAIEAAKAIGFPVVLKIHSPQISHKTDVDGVKLNLGNELEVRNAYVAVTESARKLMPDAVIQGVTVQPMVSMLHGVELILGAKRDPVFGSVMMVGFGGIAAELFQDRSLELPPINERLAMRMLRSLKSWPILSGYRGRSKVNLDQLVEVLLRFSTLLVEQPSLWEIDVNPLLVSTQGMIALDARVLLQSAGESMNKAYDHLAIRPYPVEYECVVRLRDGTDVRLRPIRPEDEPQWRAMLGRCSKESLWSRFHMLFQEATHEMATRFCFLDYDREVALVAEVESAGEKTIVGIGRLAGDADHRTAEFALLIEDRWQNRGLGSQIAQHCLSIAKPWGVQTVVAETTSNEPRMVAILRRLGFEIDYRLEDNIILGTKAVS